MNDHDREQTPRRRGRLGRGRWKRRIRRLRHSARNVGELISKGRLGQPWSAGYEVVQVGRHHRLRHYVAPPGRAPLGAPLLLVPPLMVTAEVYDISPELSAVAYLCEQGVDVWLVDFGAPEREAGGLDRTLDDHVLAVDEALDLIRELTGQDVHLAGYSQGGLFVYQTAAYRRGRGIASLITFGSPVDLRRNLPLPVHEAVAGRILRGLRKLVDQPLDSLEGLPGFLTSSGFKLLSARKELAQIADFFAKLHDREALAAREPRRRFLGGAGFVAWPGPALRDFVDQVVAGNRMASGGFVINGHMVTLADVRCPILYFVGRTDEFARPPSVRAIRTAAPAASTTEVQLDAGHFGLVVGTRALTVTWPSVVQWIGWHAGGERPSFADPETAVATTRRLRARRRSARAERILGLAWRRLGRLSVELSDNLDVARYQVPRLTRLRALDEDDPVSLGRALADRAARFPEATFFIWNDRAFSWAEADRQVTRAARVLSELGVRRGQRVGVFLANRPSYLISVAALSRLGAVAVLLDTTARAGTLDHMLDVSHTRHVITDPRHAPLLPGARLEAVWVTGRVDDDTPLPEGALHLNPLIERGVAELPTGVEPDPGRGRDLAMLIFTSGATGLPRAARITNMRWAASGLASAAACRLTPLDSIYLCLPLHHSTAMLAAVGGALQGGARLALAPRFSVQSFWSDVRRSGASVVFYVGEIVRYLTNAPVVPNEHHHPVRLFIGNGMRPDVWRTLLDRFRVARVVEFYASTEGNALLVNLSGAKLGSVGRPFTQLGSVALVRWSPASGELLRGHSGRLKRCRPGEPGVLLSRIVEDDPIARFDGYTDAAATDARIVRDAFTVGDAWYDTGDLFRVDSDGDFWFVDRLSGTYRRAGEHVSTEEVERVLQRHPQIAMAAAYGIALDGQEGRVGMCAVQLKPGAGALDGSTLHQLLVAHLSPAARPRYVLVVDDLEVTAGFERIKHGLQQAALEAPGHLYELAEDAATYRLREPPSA